MNLHTLKKEFEKLQTPFYFYDTELLQQTLDTIRSASAAMPYAHVHYAIKANANPTLLKMIAANGLGADCVSGGEIQAALAAGFPASKIVYAGVGKSDWEIELGIDQNIACFNVESLPELEIISEIAKRKGKVAKVAIRINPNIDAHTHEKITTGRKENKFGIAMEEMMDTIRFANILPSVEYVGLHFHIGSQILQLEVYEALAHRINELQLQLEKENITTRSINVGGGLGIDYDDPHANPIADFATYFDIFKNHLQLRPGQELHFELGRSVVAQCGNLIARTLYVKVGQCKQFIIVDAGFTDLVRPAMYDAHHYTENISAAPDAHPEYYDVVGPICESSDVFSKHELLPHTTRRDLIVFRSAGAYGEVMASCYNCRTLPKSYTDKDFAK